MAMLNNQRVSLTHTYQTYHGSGFQQQLGNWGANSILASAVRSCHQKWSRRREKMPGPNLPNPPLPFDGFTNGFTNVGPGILPMVLPMFYQIFQNICFFVLFRWFYQWFYLATLLWFHQDRYLGQCDFLNFRAPPVVMGRSSVSSRVLPKKERKIPLNQESISCPILFGVECVLKARDSCCFKATQTPAVTFGTFGTKGWWSEEKLRSGTFWFRMRDNSSLAIWLASFLSWLPTRRRRFHEPLLQFWFSASKGSTKKTWAVPSGTLT